MFRLKVCPVHMLVPSAGCAQLTVAVNFVFDDGSAHIPELGHWQQRQLKGLVSAGGMTAGTGGLTAAETIALPELMLQLTGAARLTGSGRAEQTAETGMSPLGMTAVTDADTAMTGTGEATDMEAERTGMRLEAGVTALVMMVESGTDQGMSGITKMTVAGMTGTRGGHLVMTNRPGRQMTRV